MNSTETFFIDNNIEVWKKTNTGVVTYFSTSEGEFFQDERDRLFKIQDGSKIPVGLLKMPKESTSEMRQLTNYRREQLILKMAYESMIKARQEIYDMKKHDVYQGNGRLNWKLTEGQKRVEEFTMLYNDLARSRVALVEVEREKKPTSGATEVSKKEYI